jgi:hypothetical protein
MERETELRVLIAYLEKDVLETAAKFRFSLSETIVKNGKLIEKYKEELEEISKTK